MRKHACTYARALRYEQTELRSSARHLLVSPAGSFSVNKFHGDLRSQNIAVANDTLRAYPSHLEDALLIRTVSMSSDSERQRMVNPRKAYRIDMGLIPVSDPMGRANMEPALEPAVYSSWRDGGAAVLYANSRRTRS